MAIGAIPSNDLPDGGPPVISAPADPPPWMKVRRDRQPTETLPEYLPVESSPAVATPSSASVSLESALANIESTPVVLRSKQKRKKSLIPIVIQQHWLVVHLQTWLGQWISRQTMLSLSFSLALHSLVLFSLALFVISRTSTPEVVSIWGGDGEAGEGGGGSGDEILIDTSVPGDAGDSAPVMLDQIAANLEMSGTAMPDATRVGAGGTGNGEGEKGGGEGGSGSGSGSGTGVGFGVGGVKVPGHAQTKGSFTAWADPRDPKPGQNYDIVIKVQLPKNVKKYRPADLTGSVKGTDDYRQEIRFKPSDQLAVEDGAVVIRIHVPGAARLVRDTIKVESKLLKEKQEFEIEF